MKSILSATVMFLFSGIALASPFTDAEMAEASRFIEEQRRERQLREEQRRERQLREEQRRERQLREEQRAFALDGQSRAGFPKLERFYKQGDKWLVAMSHYSHDMARKSTDDLPDGPTRMLKPLYYEFKVVEADEAKARIEVVPVDEQGAAIERGKFSRAIVTIDRNLKIVSKEHVHRELAASVMTRLPGHGNTPMGFETFPIELPDFESAKVLSRDAKETKLESEDLFFRPVRLSWRSGDLWPHVVESNAGRAVLVRQEKI